MKMKSKLFAIILILAPSLMAATKVTSFDGLNALDISGPTFEVDSNGAVGTKQYLQWVNSYYQAYDKTTFAPVFPAPVSGDSIWRSAGITNCEGTGGGEGTVTFDRLANVWVIARRAGPATNVYYWCIAVSNTDDLSSTSLTWHAYQFNVTPNLGLNSHANVYYPDYPRFGTWQDGYYATFDLEDPNNQYQEIGVVVCAFDRANMITGGTPRAMQCFSNPSPIPTNGALYLSHSLMPADIDGTTAPPTAQKEYLVSIQNPPADGKTLTSTTLNLWEFNVNWTTPKSSKFTLTMLTVPSYEPACYDVTDPVNTFCVPEPSSASTGNYVDSIGDRLTPRFAYRNLGTYGSFLIAQTVQAGTGKSQQTGIRWYELRGAATPTLYQDGTVVNGSVFRFVPSMAQDSAGNAAIGYSVSDSVVHPSIREATFSLPNKTKPAEANILTGVGDEENSSHWGNITSMTVDPVDGCTFWFVDEYFQANEIGSSINWDTRIANFKVSTCVAK